MKSKFWLAALAAVALVGIWGAAGISKTPPPDLPAAIPPVPAGDEVITLGAGCFWHIGAVFQQLPGVVSVTTGYMGGGEAIPGHSTASNGQTGRSEVTRIVFDPAQISLAKLLQVFWMTHRPTSHYSGQGRAVIFYQMEAQRKVAEQSKLEAAKKFSGPIFTEIAPAKTFYAAEESQQDYYAKSGNTSCGLFSLPNLKELGLK